MPSIDEAQSRGTAQQADDMSVQSVDHTESVRVVRQEDDLSAQFSSAELRADAHAEIRFTSAGVSSTWFDGWSVDWSVDLPLRSRVLVRNGIGLTMITLGGAILGGVSGTFIGNFYLAASPLMWAVPGAAIGVALCAVLQTVERRSAPERKVSNYVGLGVTLGGAIGSAVVSILGAVIGLASGGGSWHREMRTGAAIGAVTGLALGAGIGGALGSVLGVAGASELLRRRGRVRPHPFAFPSEHPPRHPGNEAPAG